MGNGYVRDAHQRLLRPDQGEEAQGREGGAGKIRVGRMKVGGGRGGGASERGRKGGGEREGASEGRKRGRECGMNGGRKEGTVESCKRRRGGQRERETLADGEYGSLPCAPLSPLSPPALILLSASFPIVYSPSLPHTAFHTQSPKIPSSSSLLCSSPLPPLQGSSILWNFGGCDPEFGAMQAKELQATLQDVLAAFPVVVRAGKAYVEACYKEVDKVKP